MFRKILESFLDGLKDPNRFLKVGDRIIISLPRYNETMVGSIVGKEGRDLLFTNDKNPLDAIFRFDGFQVIPPKGFLFAVIDVFNPARIIKRFHD